MSLVPNSRLIPSRLDLPSGHNHRPIMSKTKKNPGANWCQTRATVKQIRLPIPAQHTVLPFSARPGQSVRQKTNRNVPGTSCHLGRKKQLEGPSHLHIQLCLLRSKVGVAVTRPGKSHTCNVITYTRLFVLLGGVTLPSQRAH